MVDVGNVVEDRISTSN